MVASRKKHTADKGGALQMSFFQPESDWRPTPVSELPSWANAKRIGLDAETKDSEIKILGPGPRRGGYVVGWSIAFEDGPKFYLPFRHDMGGNLDTAQVRKYMIDNFKTGFALRKIHTTNVNEGYELGLRIIAQKPQYSDN